MLNHLVVFIFFLLHGSLAYPYVVNNVIHIGDSKVVEVAVGKRLLW